MLGKVDRVIISIYNMKRAIKVLLNDAEKKANGAIKRRLIDQLLTIDKTLKNLNFNNPFEDEKLTEIRCIALSVMHLFDEGEYNTIITEIFRANDKLCSKEKTSDKSNLSTFKRLVNSLPATYQEAIKKIEVDSEGKLVCKNSTDNVKCMAGNYLAAKYNFRSIKYEKREIDEASREDIEHCLDMAESSENEVIKKTYSDLAECILNSARAEVVIDAFHEITIRCNGVEYEGIKEVINELLEKYNLMYLENIKLFIELTKNNPITDLNNKTRTREN